MKLIDLVKVIPESETFVVEEYDETNNMEYAWLIEPYNTKHRDNLKCAHHEEVIRIYPRIGSFGKPELAIEIRYKAKEES